IRPTLSARCQDEGICCAVDFWEHRMRSRAQETNLVGYPNTPHKVAQAITFGTLTNDYKIEVRQLAHRFNHTIMPLAFDKMADRQQRRARQRQLLARDPSIGRAEHGKIDPIAEHFDTVRHSTEMHHRPFHRLTARDD